MGSPMLTITETVPPRAATPGPARQAPPAGTVCAFGEDPVVVVIPDAAQVGGDANLIAGTASRECGSATGQVARDGAAGSLPAVSVLRASLPAPEWTVAHDARRRIVTVSFRGFVLYRQREELLSLDSAAFHAESLAQLVEIAHALPPGRFNVVAAPPEYGMAWIVRPVVRA
jgi:hypothetical protein